MENTKTLEITEFLSICSQIVLRAGNIIQEVFNAEDFGHKLKNGDEPFTEADVKVQTLIIKSLRHFWPDLKIIGEEEEVFEKNLDVNFDELRRDLISKDLFKDLSSTKIDISQAIVWVDPLDGTSDFIKGALDAVTTLIGISVGQEAKVGVIGHYFVEDGEGKYNWEPKCYFAHADCPHLYCMDYLKDSKIEEVLPHARANPEKITILVTRNHFNQEVQDQLDKVQPDEVIKAGGAGAKTLLVALGKGDCLFFPRKGMKNWDVCACEAVIKSVGGILSSAKNELRKYYPEPEAWHCDNGVIVTYSPKAHDRIMSRLLQ